MGSDQFYPEEGPVRTVRVSDLWVDEHPVTNAAFRRFVKDNRLHYVNNFVGVTEQRIDGSEDLPTGTNLILSASFEKSGEQPPGTAHGTLTLFHGARQVAEGTIRTQPGMFSLAGEGLTVGRDSGEAVTDDYPGEAPWRFTGGTLHRVAVDVSGTPYVDLEREAAAMLSRE